MDTEIKSMVQEAFTDGLHRITLATDMGKKVAVQNFEERMGRPCTDLERALLDLAFRVFGEVNRLGVAQADNEPERDKPQQLTGAVCE